MIKNGLFVTGTDTGVGKTAVAAGIAAALRSRGINVGVMKPVHTGCGTREGNLTPHDSLILAGSASSDDPIELITPYMFTEAVAPYVAAIKQKVVIDVDLISDYFMVLCKRHDYMIVEGIGGVLVPVRDDFYVADLIKLLNLPVILVTSPHLGYLNHTMLTISCLTIKKIPITGIVINNRNTGNGTLAEMTFQDTVETLSGIPVLGTIPYISSLKKRLVSEALNIPDPFLKLADTLFDVMR